MMTVTLIILWVTLSVIFVLSLAIAAGRSTPVDNTHMLINTKQDTFFSETTECTENIRAVHNVATHKANHF